MPLPHPSYKRRAAGQCPAALLFARCLQPPAACLLVHSLLPSLICLPGTFPAASPFRAHSPRLMVLPASQIRSFPGSEKRFITNHFPQRGNKSANMKAVTNSMMDLDGQRHPIASLVQGIFPHCKNREQVTIAIFQIQMEAFKTLPWNHGDGKGIGRNIRLCHEAFLVPKPLQVLLIRTAKILIIVRIFRPDIRKCLAVFVENRLTVLAIR